MPDETILTEHLKGVDNRLDRLDAKVDARFEQVDKRFEQVDVRFEEQRSYFKTLHEASRSDFNNLYDFVKARTDSLDTRFDRLQTELNSRFADVQKAIASLAAQLRPRTRRSRR